MERLLQSQNSNVLTLDSIYDMLKVSVMIILSLMSECLYCLTKEEDVYCTQPNRNNSIFSEQCTVSVSYLLYT